VLAIVAIASIIDDIAHTDSDMRVKSIARMTVTATTWLFFVAFCGTYDKAGGTSDTADDSIVAMFTGQFFHGLIFGYFLYMALDYPGGSLEANKRMIGTCVVSLWLSFPLLLYILFKIVSPTMAIVDAVPETPLEQFADNITSTVAAAHDDSSTKIIEYGNPYLWVGLSVGYRFLRVWLRCGFNIVVEKMLPRMIVYNLGLNVMFYFILRGFSNWSVLGVLSYAFDRGNLFFSTAILEVYYWVRWVQYYTDSASRSSSRRKYKRS